MTARAAAATGGGILLSLAFPPVGLSLVAWVAFVPLFWALRGETRTAWVALLGAVFGATFFLLDVSWIYRTLMVHGHFSIPAAAAVFLGMVVTLALFPAVFGLLLHVFAKKGFDEAIVAPFLWVGLEYARAHLFTGFPWDLVGYSQWQRSTVIQIADLTGVYGISFIVLLVNASAWMVVRSVTDREGFKWKPAVICAASVLAAVLYGYNRLAVFPPYKPDKGSPAVGMLQGNIPQEIKWERSARRLTFATYENLAEQAVREGSRFLVWPETSVPVLLGGPDLEWRQVTAISQAVGVPMLVGAPSLKIEGGKQHFYNSAFLVEGGMLRYRYDKIHLVPFGEYMPLTWLLPLGTGLAAREEDYSPGHTMTVMSAEGFPPFSVLICYEAIFPELARMALKNGAKLLVNITNDGWFGETAAPYQHLIMAGMRSVENRIWLVRTANTGITTVFDPGGRMMGSIPLNKAGILVTKIPGDPQVGTFYTKFGDVFAWCCLGICGAAFVSVTGRGSKS